MFYVQRVFSATILNNFFFFFLLRFWAKVKGFLLIFFDSPGGNSWGFGVSRAWPPASKSEIQRTKLAQTSTASPWAKAEEVIN